MKEQKANDVASRDEKQTADSVTIDVNASTKIPTTSTALTKLLVEKDTSNGGPKVAAALLSLGQDLTNGEAADVSVAAVLVPPPGRPSTDNQRDHLENPLELVVTSDIPMLPIDIGTEADKTTGEPIAIKTKENANQKKRKHSNPKANKNDSGNPPDFWHWLPVGENVRNWDVLCGRGGE